MICLESRGLKYKNLIPSQTTQFVRQMKIGWNLLFSWQKCKYAFQMKFHANINRNVSFFKCIFFSNSPNVNKKLCNRFGEWGERECKWSQHIYLHDLVAKQAHKLHLCSPDTTRSTWEPSLLEFPLKRYEGEGNKLDIE